MKSHLFAATSVVALACVATPALAQDATESTVDSIIVTGTRNPDDPPVVAEARTRLSRTPGAVSVVAAETFEDRFAQGFYFIQKHPERALDTVQWAFDGRYSGRLLDVDDDTSLPGVELTPSLEEITGELEDLDEDEEGDL